MYLSEDMLQGELYNPAMLITDQKSADEYFNALVERSVRMGASYKAAVLIEKSNLGYWSGYFDFETRKRVEVLYGTVHPIFGKATELEDLPPDQLWAEIMGKVREFCYKK